jgi:hypothetical protein
MQEKIMASPSNIQPPLLYPHAPPFEHITKTLLRHIDYARKTRYGPSHSRPSRIQIFSSVRAELDSALTVLNLDLLCNVCDDIYREIPKDKRHVNEDLKGKLKRLQRAIERLDERNWMDEVKLTSIGEGFGRVRREYKARWRESTCLLGGWKEEMPWGTSGRSMDTWLFEGVKSGECFR